MESFIKGLICEDLIFSIELTMISLHVSHEDDPMFFLGYLE